MLFNWLIVTTSVGMPSGPAVRRRGQGPGPGGLPPAPAEEQDETVCPQAWLGIQVAWHTGGMAYMVQSLQTFGLV